MIRGKLVGWDRHASRALANRAAELGHALAQEQRSHLLSRLGHKLRSATLALGESARQAAFGRPEMLEEVFQQAQEVGLRAAAFESAAIDPSDQPRSVVLGAVLSLAAPGPARDVPADAVVLGSEPLLVDAFTRAIDWMGGPQAVVAAERVGNWWRVRMKASGERRPPPIPEMGEPLLRLMVDMHLGGWLDNSNPERLDIYLPAHKAK